MFRAMNVSRSALSRPPDQQKLSGALVIPNADRLSQGTAGGAIQPAAAAEQADGNAHGGLAVILEGIGDAFYSLDGEWRFTYINRAAQEYFGVPAQSMLGRIIWDIFPHSEGTDLRRRYEDVFRTGIAASFESRAVSA
ncbi:MAG TPA: PAS domain-containing protein, partial [Microvirga sp.]|nr:PAS domain-containing protein [Microvirga sp.]